MGLTKANGYTAKNLERSAITKAMGHPARQLIVEFVLTRPLVRNVDLPALLNLSGASVQRHLCCLYGAGVLRPIYHIHFSEIVVVPESIEVVKEYVDSIWERVSGQKR